MKKIALSNMEKLYKAISNDMKLYIPVESGNNANYMEWQEGAKVTFDKMTTKSAKDAFFPQCENLSKFSKEDNHIVVEKGQVCEDDFVVMGVRACDVKAFDILNRVFLAEPADTFYKARHDHSIIISLSCKRPEETCFCTTFGIDPAEPKGDVAMYIVNDYAYFSSNTEKGEKFMAKYDSLFEDADASDVEPAKKATREIMTKLPLHNVTTEGWGGDKLDEMFNRPEWKELSDSCIACGTCTYVCPTCQCYDIRDYKTNKGVVRYRCWDSCMRSDFTMMAHGNNRTTQLQRFRQRFMHKLVYFPANNDGEFSCVGCGRCVAKCPVSMNIVKVIKTMGGKK